LKRAGSHGEGTWCPPGGHLEFGESLEVCALREAREETGVEVTDLRFLAITNDLFPEGKHYITIWMEGSYASGEATIGEPQKASEVGWFSWGSVPEPRFLPLQNLLAGRSRPTIRFDRQRNPHPMPAPKIPGMSQSKSGVRH
jgi:8-oxo-dGTP diphosphatase